MTVGSTIAYVTSSAFKKEEVETWTLSATFADGTPVRDVFTIDIREVSVPERLETDLARMVRHEVVEAYEVLRVPCIVEHAGLIFEGLDGANYPGGLTKPMWNELKEHFPTETRSADRRAAARAEVAYCNGMEVHVFSGTTRGRLSATPKGSRSFYWDTIFIPDDPRRPENDLTYAQIVEDVTLGLSYKMLNLSQSAKAMLACLEFIRTEPRNRLWA